MRTFSDRLPAGPFGRLVTLGSLALLATAVLREVRRPAGQRTGEGVVAGVPYDLRLPTPARLRAAYWNPADPRLFTPRPAGVGWAVNVPRLLPRR